MHAVWGPTNPGHEKALRQNTLQKCQGYHFMMSAHSCIFRIHTAAIFWVKYSLLRSARVFLGRPWFCQFPALTWRSKDTRRETRRSGLVFGFRWFPDSAAFSLHKLGMISKLGPSLRIKLVERLLGIGKLLHCGILWAHKCKPTLLCLHRCRHTHIADTEVETHWNQGERFKWFCAMLTSSPAACYLAPGIHLLMGFHFKSQISTRL